MKQLVCAVVALMMALGLQAKTCTWKGGSGSWSNPEKWTISGAGDGDASSVPADGDHVCIDNSDASAEVVNDIDGLSLVDLSVTGTAACTLSGKTVTLTDPNAFSNGVANTVCVMPLVLEADSPMLRTAYAMTFKGKLSGTTPTAVTFYLCRKAWYVPTVESELEFPSADIRVSPNADQNSRGIDFKGKIVAASLCKGISTGSVRGSICLHNSANSLPQIRAPYADIECKAANVMTNAVLDFGYCEDQRGRFLLNGYDQMIDRFLDYSGSHAIVTGSGVLTMRATADCTCPATFGGSLSVVWDPVEPDATLVFARNRTHGTTGNLTIKGGVARLTGTFKKVPSVVVEDGATFAMESTVSGAFAALKTLTVGHGAKFTIGATAAAPFTDDSLSIVAFNDSEITIPNGVAFRCKDLKVDGAYVSAEGNYTGWDNENPGSATKLEALRGTGTVFVPYHPAEDTAATWTGGGGTDVSAMTALNWGGELPDLVNGGLCATFATAGERAEFPSGKNLRGMVFNAPGSFAVAADGELGIFAAGVTCTATGGARTYDLRAPLLFRAEQSWAVGENATLDLDAPVSNSEGVNAWTVSGLGTLNLNATNSSYTGSLGLNVARVNVNSAKDAFGAPSDEQVTVKESISKLKFKGSLVERPLNFAGANSSYATTLSESGTSNEFSRLVSYTSVWRPCIAGTAVFCGGIRRGSTAYSLFAPIVKGVMCVVEEPLSSEYFEPQDGGVGGGIVRLAVEGNVASMGCVLRETLQLHLDVEDAFSGYGTPLQLVDNSKIELNGHSQHIGSFKPDWVSGDPNNGWIRSAAPATLFFRQSEAWTWTYRRALGQLSLSKSGAATFTLARNLEATGSLEVTEGTFAFASGGAWAGATNVLVSGTGVLSLAGSAGLSSQTDVAISDSGKISLGDGVNQTVSKLFVNGRQLVKGTWGSSQSAATNRDDVHFAGTGMLTVRRGGGLVLVVR